MTDLGTWGAWLHPSYGDEDRVRLARETEALGYRTVWLGLGRRDIGDLDLVERVLDATSRVTVATSIINVWTNEADQLAESFHRVFRKHPGRLLLGIGIGHPESVAHYRSPLATLSAYLDKLDEGGVPVERRALAALGPQALRLARDRALGSHPYLTVPDHTRSARTELGSAAVLAPEQTVVVDNDEVRGRALGRDFVRSPYLELGNYVSNLKRHGFTDDDVSNGGSDHLIDTLVIHGDVQHVADGLREHRVAGADHVAIQALAPAGEDPLPAYAELAEILL